MKIVSVYIWECTHRCTNDAIDQYNNITQLFCRGFFKLHNNTLLQFNISEEANHSLSLIDLLSDSTVTNTSVSDHEKTILSHKIVPVETAKYDDLFITSTPSKRNKLYT